MGSVGVYINVAYSSARMVQTAAAAGAEEEEVHEQELLHRRVLRLHQGSGYGMERLRFLSESQVVRRCFSASVETCRTQMQELQIHEHPIAVGSST